METSAKLYATPTEGHVSLGQGLRVVLAAILILPLVASAVLGSPQRRLGAIVIGGFWLGVVSGVRVAAEWERGVVLRLGKCIGVKGPGIFYVVPGIETVQFIDTRTLVINIPRQKVITRDNVPAEIDSALFFQVSDSEKAVTLIRDFQFAISQYAQAALRDVIGGLTLDELLSEREQIQEKSLKLLKKKCKDGGYISIQFATGHRIT